MQAVEALTILIRAGDEVASNRRYAAELPDTDFPTPSADRTSRVEEAEQLSVASAICQAMLNTALPVAKYRAFIEVEDEQPKRSKFQQSIAVSHEFTICSVNMAGIISGLKGVTQVPTNVKVTVWEQRANGADMISGYQGQTKGKPDWARFLNGLLALESMPTVQ